jgi:predicted transcriptional regulator
MEGKTIEKIAQFLGDTEETVRKNYIHLTPDYLEDVVD